MLLKLNFKPKPLKIKLQNWIKSWKNFQQLEKNLVVQYRIEKEEQLKVNENRDYVRERANENSVLYNSLLKVNLIGNVTNSLNIVFNQKENRDNTITVIRKR
jgi:hypothetical protein